MRHFADSWGLLALVHDFLLWSSFAFAMRPRRPVTTYSRIARFRSMTIRRSDNVRASREKDDNPGTTTTGHEWDGIKELNTPLPRWWLWTFYGTIVWALGYIDRLSGLAADQFRHAAACSAIPAAPKWRRNRRRRCRAEPSGATRSRPHALKEISQGSRALRNSPVPGALRPSGSIASQCHGSGAAGGKGYPNLNDDDWLWGGTLEQIHTTLKNGIRFTSDAGHAAITDAGLRRDGILTPDADQRCLANLCCKLSGQTL